MAVNVHRGRVWKFGLLVQIFYEMVDHPSLYYGLFDFFFIAVEIGGRDFGEDLALYFDLLEIMNRQVLLRLARKVGEESSSKDKEIGYHEAAAGDAGERHQGQLFR